MVLEKMMNTMCIQNHCFKIELPPIFIIILEIILMMMKKNNLNKLINLKPRHLKVPCKQNKVEINL